MTMQGSDHFLTWLLKTAIFTLRPGDSLVWRRTGGETELVVERAKEKVYNLAQVLQNQDLAENTVQNLVRELNHDTFAVLVDMLAHRFALKVKLRYRGHDLMTARF